MVLKMINHVFHLYERDPIRAKGTDERTSSVPGARVCSCLEDDLLSPRSFFCSLSLPTSGHPPTDLACTHHGRIQPKPVPQPCALQLRGHLSDCLLCVTWSAAWQVEWDTRGTCTWSSRSHNLLLSFLSLILVLCVTLVQKQGSFSFFCSFNHLPQFGGDRESIE